MRAPAKRKTSKAVAALEAKIAPHDARPRICVVGAEVYQALLFLAQGEGVSAGPNSKGETVYEMGPLRLALSPKAVNRMTMQGLVRAARDGDVIRYQMTKQGEAAAEFARERFPDGWAYPTLKYIRKTADVREDEAFRAAFGADQEAKTPKAAKRERAAA